MVMRTSLKVVLGVVPALLLLGGSALAQSQTYGIGRAPTAEELVASSITISPEGVGLPVGHGDAKTGAQLFIDKGCSGCHGEGAVGGISSAPNLKAPKGPEVDAWDRGAGGNGIPVKAPTATIAFDFINRGMPLGNEGSLTADEVYSLTAYLLAINQIIPQDQVLNQDNLAKTQMPMKSNEWFVAPDWKVGSQRMAGYPY